jgi:hypothetical protein
MLTVVLWPALGETGDRTDSKKLKGRYALEEHLLEAYQLLRCAAGTVVELTTSVMYYVDLDDFFPAPRAGVGHCHCD